MHMTIIDVIFRHSIKEAKSTEKTAMMKELPKTSMNKVRIQEEEKKLRRDFTHMAWKPKAKQFFIAELAEDIE